MSKNLVMLESVCRCHILKGIFRETSWISDWHLGYGINHLGIFPSFDKIKVDKIFVKIRFICAILHLLDLFERQHWIWQNRPVQSTSRTVQILFKIKSSTFLYIVDLLLVLDEHLHILFFNFFPKSLDCFLLTFYLLLFVCCVIVSELQILMQLVALLLRLQNIQYLITRIC